MNKTDHNVDISQRQGLESLSDYLSNSSESLHIVAGDASIMWANQTELEFLGYDADTYIGSSIIDYHEDLEVITDILTRLLGGEVLKNYPAKLKAADGNVKHALINSSGYWKEGEFSHTRCFSRDVTGLFDLSDKINENIKSILANNP